MEAATGEWVQRYLRLLGAEPEHPGVEALGRLIRANVLTIPFVNVSSILRRAQTPVGAPVPPLDTEEILISWEEQRSGGVCFERTVMFGRLLGDLGYDAHPIMANASFPGSHNAVLVHLEGKRYLAEVGAGSPFFDPIPLGAAAEVRHAGLTYRFRPGDAPDVLLQERLIDGAWTPFFSYDLRVPDDDAVEEAYQRHHTPGQSWVVDDLFLVRSSEVDVKVFRNQQFTHYTQDGKHSERITDPAAIAHLVSDVFALPKLPIAESLRAQAAFAHTRGP